MFAAKPDEVTESECHIILMMMQLQKTKGYYSEGTTLGHDGSKPYIILLFYCSY